MPAHVVTENRNLGEMIHAVDIRGYAADLFARRPPKSQEDCCRLAAHVAVACDDGPWTEDHIRETSQSMAEGLFGPAWAVAGVDQRSAWVRMCVAALRDAII